MGVISQRHGDIAEITLDWPEKRNALGPDEGRELRLALEKAVVDKNVGAIIISAKGKAFCAGGNLPALIRLVDAGGKKAVGEKIYGEFQGIFRAIGDAPVPVITAVDGPAIGFGCDLALAGSATFIGAKGWLAQGWIRAGLIPATGGTLYVKRRGGQQAVFRFLAADKIDGPTAERWNLAIACEDAHTAAIDMAETLSNYPRTPLKAIVELARHDDRDDHLAMALDYQVNLITDPDFKTFAAKLLRK